MPPIPQITRERLASSVVGTPGVDTSSADIASSVADFGQTVSALAGRAAIEHQQALDAAEANRLTADFKIAATNSLASHKEAYANDPLGKSELLNNTLKDNLDSTLSKASNSRVKQMLTSLTQPERGSAMIQEALWAHTRKIQIEETGIVDTSNRLAIKGSQIGSDTSISYEEKNKQISDLFNSAGNILESARHLQFRPEKMAELEQKIPKSILSGVVYGMIDNNPAQAVTYLDQVGSMTYKDAKGQENPIFSMDEIRTLKSAAMESLKNFDKTAVWKSTAKTMVQAPELTQAVLAGEIKWSDLNQMPETPFIKTLKDIALNTSPAAQLEVEAEKVKLIDDFQNLGISKDHMTAAASATAVIDFSHKLAEAFQKQVINKDTFDTMNKQLASPLVSAVLAKHDPSFFDNVGSVVMHPVMTFKNFINPAASKKLNEYQNGFKEIDAYLKTLPAQDNFANRSQLYSKFLDIASKADLETKDNQGRVYKGTTIARTLLGINEATVHDTPIGPKKIIGYAGPGNPILDTTDEEDQMVLLPLLEKRLRKR